MKKKLVLILIVFIPFLTFSQGDIYNHNKPNIGIQLAYSEHAGMLTGAEFSYPLTKNIFTRLQLRTLKTSLRKISLGVGLVIPLNKWLDINIGAEYEYKKLWNYKPDPDKKTAQNIIIPIDFVFHINKRFAFKAGYTNTINLNNVLEQSRFLSSWQFSFIYKF